MIDQVPDGNAKIIIESLDILKFRLKERPKIYEELAEKCKLPLAHDINDFSLDQISILMDLFSQDQEYISFLVQSLMERLEMDEMVHQSQ